MIETIKEKLEKTRVFAVALGMGTLGGFLAWLIGETFFNAFSGFAGYCYFWGIVVSAFISLGLMFSQILVNCVLWLKNRGTEQQ